MALVAGILYLNQFRAGLIDTRVQSLLVQGQIIAAAIAAQATVDTDAITSIPTSCWSCRPGRAARPTGSAKARRIFPIDPETRRAAASAPDLADAHARAHLRHGRHADPRFARPLYARPHPELRPAAARRGEEHRRALVGRGEALVPPRRAAGLRGDRLGQRPRIHRGRLGAERAVGERRARRRGRRADRLGRGAGAALPRHPRQPAPLDRIGRHRRHRAGRAHGDHARVPGRRRRHRAPVDPARQHHRRTGAPARRRGRAGAPRRQASARGNPRPSAAARTRSGISRACSPT